MQPFPSCWLSGPQGAVVGAEIYALVINDGRRFRKNMKITRSLLLSNFRCTARRSGRHVRRISSSIFSNTSVAGKSSSVKSEMMLDPFLVEVSIEGKIAKTDHDAHGMDFFTQEVEKLYLSDETLAAVKAIVNENYLFSR